MMTPCGNNTEITWTYVNMKTNQTRNVVTKAKISERRDNRESTRED